MEQIFLKVLNMSLMASWVILVLLLLRPLLKKAPGWISAGLWLVALLRLLCPVSFESPFTLMRIRSQSIPSDIAMNRVPQIESGSAILDHAVNNALENPAFTPNDGGSVNPLQIWIWLAAWIWLLGILVMVVYSAVSLYRLHRRLKGAVPLRDTAPLQQDVAGMLPDAGNRVFVCCGLETAFVVGLARPKIYLPSGLGEEERAYVLFHEKTHIKRKDHLVKALAFAALCIHWFNPLAWAAFHMTGRDMERACDEAVLRKMGSDTQLKKAYSESLLRLAAGRRNTCGTPIAFGEGEVKSRVKNVLQYKKPAAWAVAVIAVLCLALAFGLLTNRADEKVNLEDAIAEDLETISKSLYVDSPMKTKVQLSDKAREYLEALYSQERELNEKYHMIHANYKATVTLVEKREDRQWIFLDYQVLSTWNYANAGKPQDMDSAASVLASVIYDTKEEQIVEIEGLDFFNPLRS